MEEHLSAWSFESDFSRGFNAALSKGELPFQKRFGDSFRSPNWICSAMITARDMENSTPSGRKTVTGSKLKNDIVFCAKQKVIGKIYRLFLRLF